MAKETERTTCVDVAIIGGRDRLRKCSHHVQGTVNTLEGASAVAMIPTSRSAKQSGRESGGDRDTSLSRDVCISSERSSRRRTLSLVAAYAVPRECNSVQANVDDQCS